MDYDFFMKQALKQAVKAYDINEVPIGCIIIHNGKIIARGYNKRNIKKNTTMHAEMIAINKACNVLKDWRLDDTCLFVTVEPCPMCAGAILQARIPKVVFGAYNKKAGCLGSIINLANDNFNHKIDVVQGTLQDECSSLMKKFFKKIRQTVK